MSRSTTVRCDKCARTISAGASVVEINVTAGALAPRIHNQVDLCPECGSAFAGWLADRAATATAQQPYSASLLTKSP